VSVDLLCMGEAMLEFSQLPVGSDGVQHYLEGFGGDTSNAAIAAARQGARVGYVTARWGPICQGTGLCDFGSGRG
jgi:2-dehydro-3-deoxygluconokinase